MRKSFLLLLSTLFCLHFTLRAEADVLEAPANPGKPDIEKPLKRGDKAFDQYEFLKAIDYYKVAFMRAPNNAEVTRKLGECYRKLGMLQEAEYWYKKTVEGDFITSDDLYYYARVLTGLGRYEDARVWYNRYHQVSPSDVTVLPVIENESYFEELLAMNPAHEVKNLELNNDKPTMCAIPFDEGILFSAAGLDQHREIEETAVYWEFDNYLDMFYASLDNEGNISDPQVVEELNTLYNDGPVAFDPKSQTLFVTQNQVKRSKPIANKEGDVQLKIHMFTYDGGKWKDAGDFPYTSTEYSLAHPAISLDAKYLFFASNMPGGYGGTDIYRCERTAEGWGEPENLGSDVNTSGNEVFPFEAGNNVLYFSSDGYPGLGGLDVYRTYEFDDQWTSAENMGVPINSPSDDFGLTFTHGSSGFFSSNRKGKGLDDDIYWFDLLSKRKFFQVAMQKLGEQNGVAAEDMVLTNMDTGEKMTLTEIREGVSSFEAIEQFSYELSWNGEGGETNRLYFLNDEHQTQERDHAIGNYHIRPDVDDQTAVDVTMSTKLKSSTNDLEKLLEEFNLFNITDNPNYVNPVNDSPSWMEEYAVTGTFDYSNGLKDMAGETVTVKNIDTGEMTTVVVDENGEFELDINPNHAYDVYFERDGKLYQHVLTPSGDYFNVDHTAARESLLEIELVNREAERQAMIAMRMAELTAEPLKDGEVKVLNLSNGDINAYAPDKSGEIVFETGSKHGYEVFWKEGKAVSQHSVKVNDGELEVTNYDEPFHILDAHLEENAVRARLMYGELADNLSMLMEDGQVALLDELTQQLVYLTESEAGEVTTDLDLSHKYSVFWQTAEGLLVYALESNAANSSLLARNQGGTKRPLRTNLNENTATLSLGELPRLALAVDRVHFDYNRSEVREQDHHILQQAIQLLTENPDVKIDVVGHTDSRGSKTYNLALSQKRAKSVMDYLIEQGVDPEQLNMYAEGEETPEEDCPETKCTEAQHQSNRRAELRLVLPNELANREDSSD